MPAITKIKTSLFGPRKNEIYYENKIKKYTGENNGKV
jgi:hypothetical protein